MGNREALLAGAKRCLLEKGYERTTVRDITAAAGGVSMAAIGYHFGSREALLTEALLQAMDDWGSQIQEALTVETEPDARPDERYEAAWTRMVESFTSQRQLWLASVEAMRQVGHSAELRLRLAAGLEEGRRGMVAWLQMVAEDTVSEAAARSLGSVQMALVSGLMVQWLTDPDHAPTGADVVEGLRAIVAGLGPPRERDDGP